MLFIELPKDKKIYFASDNHLGAPTAAEIAKYSICLGTFFFFL